jgi:ABC-type Fe3+ transport system permease subunit
MPSGSTASQLREPTRRRRFDTTRALQTAQSRGETLDQVLDRNVAELLQELRVAFTGVQILFAFLLSLAFTQRFEDLDSFGLAAYTIALLSTALATMVLIAPVSFHRIVFRRRQKAALVVVSDRLLMAGIALLIPAIGSSVLLVLDVVLGRWQAIVGCSVTILVALLTWYALPLAIRFSGQGTAPSHRRAHRARSPDA